MDKEQKKYLKSLASSEKMFEAVRDYVLDFGIINIDEGTDAELGARLRAREELIKDIRKKFNDIAFLVDED